MAMEGTTYHFNLDNMSRTEMDTGRMLALRFSPVGQMQSISAQGFEMIRQTFKRVVATDVLRGRLGAEPSVTEESLLYHWPGCVDDEELLRVTVEEVFQAMTLTNIKRVNMAEWIHYWVLRTDDRAPMPSVADINGRLQLLLQYDPKVLERLQLLFELTAEPTGWVNAVGCQLSMSLQCLLQVCHSLLACPNFVLEQELAREVLARHRGQDVEDGERLLYHDFLNVMLGRQRRKVYIWMYDISNGKANGWSWILGTHFPAFWHTAVVVDLPEGPLEFWYGGRLYMSKPGTTPFGAPVEKRFMGHSYRSQEEIENHISCHLAHDFEPGNYDSLSHNCNHFSDSLLRYLIHQPLPDEILHQPEMIMNSTPVLQLLRPFLNRWLGRVDAASLDGTRTTTLQESVPLSPLALVSFVLHDCGLESVGRVEAVEGDHCVVSRLDLWRQRTVEHTVPQSFVKQVLQRSQRDRFLVRHRCADVAPVASGLPVAHRPACCWLPVLLQPEIMTKPSALSFHSAAEEDPVHVANF